MIDFVRARRMMVDGQIRTNDVTNPDLIAAILNVSRERFVPSSQRDVAYLDRDTPLDAESTNSRYLLKPMVFAKMLQAAEIQPNDHVLDVGCGTGYSSAVIAHLAHTVIALENEPRLAQLASNLLSEEHLSNVTVVQGPLEGGWPAKSPYDVIFLNGAVEFEPHNLFRQLKEGGRLVAVFGAGQVGKVKIYRQNHDGIAGRPIFDAKAATLPDFAKSPVFVF